MTTTIALLGQLKAKNISISLDESSENLRIRGELSNLTDNEKSHIKEKKSELIAFLKEQHEKTESIEKTELAESYPISDAQRRLWTLSQFTDGSIAYNMPGRSILNQHVNIEILKRAIYEVINRHEILRTVFKESANGEVRQWVLEASQLGFQIGYIDYRSQKNKKQLLEEYIAEDSYNKIFDLENGPLLRTAIIQMEEDEYVLYFNMHHIISDGWSMKILFKDVLSYYEAFKKNIEPQLEALKIQYKDYSVWQLNLLKNENFNKQRSYWLDQLKGDLTLLNLPSVKKRPAVKTFNGRTVFTYLSKDLTDRLREYSLAQKGTMFMVTTAAIKAFFFRYTGIHDLIFGNSIAGRGHVDIENQIGFYVNTLVLRTKIYGQDNFNEVYAKVKQTILGANKNQMYPFDRLVEELQQKRLTSRGAIFDVLIGLKNMAENSGNGQIDHQNLDDIIVADNVTCKHDVAINFEELGAYLSMTIEYNTDVYEDQMFRDFIRHFKSFLEEILDSPNQQIQTIDFLSIEDKTNPNFVLQRCKQNQLEDINLLDLFRLEENSTSDNHYLGSNKEISYSELDQYSNQIANYLYNRIELQKEDVVAVILDSNRNTRIAQLGVLKAGAAYLSIDLSWSDNRIISMLEEVNVKALIIEEKYIEQANKLQWSIKSLKSYLCIDSNEIKKVPEFEQDATLLEELWDYVGEKAEDQITGGGWQSSYTGEALSQIEMEEYAMNIYKKVENVLTPTAAILEIGCSSGLTLSKLAPNVGSYYGTDLSSEIIAYTQKFVDEKGFKNVKLKKIAAHDISNLDEKKFDLIIINSVIHLFYGYNYLTQVIKDCVSLLKSDGHLFIGDVMDLDKKEELINDIKVFKRKNYGDTSENELDNKLFVSRNYFQDLKFELREIADVVVSEKIGTVENELTKFRYDVILQIDKKNTTDKGLTKERSNLRHKWQFGRAVLDEQSTKNVNLNINHNQLAYVVSTPNISGSNITKLSHCDIVAMLVSGNPIDYFLTNKAWSNIDAFTLNNAVAELNHLKGNIEDDYWQDQLNRNKFKLVLPEKNRYNPNLSRAVGHELTTYLNPSVQKALKEYTSENGGNLFEQLITVWHALSYMYSSQTDLMVGTIIPQNEDNKSNFHLNTVVLNSEMDENDNFDSLYQKVKEITEFSTRNAPFPFSSVLEKFSKRGLKRPNSTIDLIIVSELGSNEEETCLDSKFDWDQIERGGYNSCKYDFIISAHEFQNHIKLKFSYNSERFEEETVLSLIKHYKFTLNELIRNTQQPIAGLDLLSVEEKNELITDFNRTSVVYPRNVTLIDLFEAQVSKTPKKVAVHFRGTELTYQELDELSNQFANYINVKNNIHTEDLIGIILDRSEWQIVAILAVLKLGAAYVPIDSNYPEQRIAYIKEDTNLKLCIDEIELAKFIKTKNEFSKLKIDVKIKPNNLAYIIYTSGSTGNPKGVMIEHQSVINYNNWFTITEGITQADSSLVISSLAFDGILTSVYGCLLNGGVIHLLTQEEAKEPSFLNHYVVSNEITFIKATPIYLNLLLSAEGSAALLDSKKLRLIITGGDVANYADIKRIKSESQIRLMNHYGPTETTIGSAACIIKESQVDQFERNSWIGRPIFNTKIYILNQENKLLPKGMEGEICISGDGLARGYWNRADLSMEKFIRNPFNDEERLYKTGDIGRFDNAGNIEFLGRKDDQVKVRGYRVELGEIQNALMNIKEIEQAFVMIKNNEQGEKDLVAYLKVQKSQNIKHINSYLSEILPEYMIPGIYVEIPNFPLTTNGKVDKKALLRMEGVGLDSGTTYVAPRNETESAIVEIWERILERKKIGILEDFFGLGGHSIRAVKLSNEYRRGLDVDISLVDLFKHTTVEAQAKLVQSLVAKKYNEIPALTPLNESEMGHPVSDAQRRLWVLSRFNESSVAYNTSNNIILDHEIDFALFKKAINAVIERHEILRTLFKTDSEGVIKQWIVAPDDLELIIDYKDCSNETNQQQNELINAYVLNDILQPFDLENGPLLRAALIKLSSQASLFYYSMHHIISDGWSQEVLARDVMAFYDFYSNGKELEIEPLRIQYKDYASWQLNEMNKSQANQHRDYWLNLLGGELPVLDLPSLKQRPRIKTNKGHGLQAYLDADTTQKLKAYAEANGGSLFMGLLASWNVLMYRYTNQRDIVIGSSIAGREHPDLENQIGFYSNTIAARNQILENDNFNSFFNSIKQNTLKNFEHQSYPFIRLVEELNQKADSSRNAVFDVMMFLQNNGKKPDEYQITTEEIDVIIDKGYCPSKFDLNVGVIELGDIISMHFVFNPDVYEKKMMENLIQHYKQLINVLVDNPTENLATVDFLTPLERDNLLNSFNLSDPSIKTKISDIISNRQTVLDLFEIQVARTPENVAVSFGNKSLKYAELNDLANQLANYLIQNHSISPDNLIGMMLNRSEWLIVSMLAIMKTGAAYLPIDPEDSFKRKEHIISDSNIKILIAEVDFIHDVDYYDGEIVAIDIEFEPEDYSTDKPKIAVTPDHLAYVIYTSGSTGKPKGVLNTLKGITDYTLGVIDKTNIQDCKTFGLVSTIAADLGNTVIFPALLTGGNLRIIAKEDLLSINKLSEFNIDCIKMTPSHWKALQTNDRYFTPNTCLILGGETFSTEILNYLKRAQTNCQVYNHYGPTETTVGKLIFKIDDQKNYTEIPLGKPIGNNKVYVLNDNLQLCPIGVTGEICISGIGVARGYLSQDNLADNKFLINPFNPDEHLYKTGDLGKWLSSGEIVFMGRKDDQVKIRGYRVELGEVEGALLKQEGILDATVKVWNHQDNEETNGANSENKLVAYIVSKKEQNSTDLRAGLRKILPEYMLPASYVELESLPLTSNGKVDKNVLPNPNNIAVLSGTEYIAPRNEIEERILEIISYIVGKPENQISVFDNFFDLGISSLGLLKLYNSINDKLNVNLQVVSVFEFSTVSALSSYISDGSKVDTTLSNVEDVSNDMDEMIDLM